MKYSTDNTPTIYFYALPWKLKRNGRKKRGQLDYWKDFFLFIYIIGMSGFTQVSYELNDHGSSHIFTFLFLFFVVIFVCFFNQFCYVSYHKLFSFKQKSQSPLFGQQHMYSSKDSIYLVDKILLCLHVRCNDIHHFAPPPPPPQSGKAKSQMMTF